MAIRLCHSCAREVNEGDKSCRYCNAILDQHQSIIEVVGDDGGFSFGTNKNAYEDEVLKNFKQEQDDINYMERKNKNMSFQNIKKEEALEENVEDFDDNLDVENMYNGIVDIIKNPKDYIALFVGLLSCILFVVGILCPVFYGIEGTIHYIYQEDMYYFGFFIMLLIIIAVVVIIKAKQKFVIIPSIFSITLLIYLLFYFASIESFSKLGWGYYILWFASILMITSAVVLGKKDEGAKRGDSRNTPLCKRDFVWMLLTVAVSMLIVSKFIDDGIIGLNNKSEASSESSNSETSVKIVVDDGNVGLNIKDTYIIEDDGQDAAIVKVTLYNNRGQAVSFDEVFTITVYQDERQLDVTEDIDTDFDLSTSNLLVAAGSSQDIYFGYILENQEELEIMVYRNSSNEVVYDDAMGFNSQFYATEEPEQIEVTKKPVVSKAPVSNENESSTPDNGKVDEEVVVTQEPVATPKPTVKPTTQPTPTPQPDSWDIYFNKPSYWGDTVYVYMYIRDDSTGELKDENINEKDGNGNKGWPGQKMTKVSDGIYKFTYSGDWYKVGRCLFSDGSNQYPEYSEEKATGVWMTGNLNVSVPQ